MLTGASKALVKEAKKRKFQVENNIFCIFEELVAHPPISHYYVSIFTFLTSASEELSLSLK